MAIAAPIQVTRAMKDQFLEMGYVVVRGLFSPEECARLRQRADDIAHGRVHIPQGELVHGRSTGVARRKPGVNLQDPSTNPVPEIHLTDRHARRGYQVYHRRQRPIDEAALAAKLADGDPWNDITTFNHLADHDEVFREYCRHSNIVAVLQEVLSTHCKLFYDHLYNKMPYGGANRFHQDGFFTFSDRSVTVWIALDRVTRDNGPFYYLPETLGYGQFDFDRLEDGITAEHLREEAMIEMEPGDAAIHDHWTIHGTGPNETVRPRRGWALHYVKAKARLVRHDTAYNNSNAKVYQTPDGIHWYGEAAYGNLHYQQVCGHSFPGCI